MPTSRFSYLTCLGAVFLMLPAVLNGIIEGGPFLYHDTSGYLRNGHLAILEILNLVQGKPPSFDSALEAAGGLDYAPMLFLLSRSVFYGMSAFVSNVLSDGWAIVAVQALTTSGLIVAVFGLALPAARAATILGTIALLTLVTPVGLFVGLVTPDIWAGLMILAAAILVLWWARLSWTARGACLTVVVLSALFHSSHLLLLIAGLVLLAIGTVLRPRAKSGAVPDAGSGSIAPLGALALCIGIVVLGNLAAVRLIQRVPDMKILALPNLTAHLVDTGPGVAYLQTRCPEEAGFAVCRFADDLPIYWIDFMFGTSPGYFITADPETQQALFLEQGDLGLAILRDAPVALTATLALDGLRQAGMFRIADFPVRPSSRAARGELTGPAAYAGLQRYFTRATYAATGLAALILALMPWRRLPGPLIGLVLIGLGGVLLNAAICGGLASPYDRFQARVIWIVVLFAAMALVAVRQSRNATTTRQAELAGQEG